MSRLAWFPFYVDDWLGGTQHQLPVEQAAYLCALLAQWKSKDLKAIPDDEERLRVICRGAPFTAAVREKFQSVEIEGKKFLRNERLAKEWERAKAEHHARVNGGKIRRSKAQVVAERVAELPPEHIAELPTELGLEHPAEHLDNSDISDVLEQTSPDWQTEVKDLLAQVPAEQVAEQVAELPHNSQLTTHNSHERQQHTKDKDGSLNAKKTSRSSRAMSVCDEAYLAELQAKPCYLNINVSNEFHKMVTWCEQNRAHPTRRRFVNWLNRARPMRVHSAPQSQRKAVIPG